MYSHSPPEASALKDNEALVQALLARVDRLATAVEAHLQLPDPASNSEAFATSAAVESSAIQANRAAAISGEDAEGELADESYMSTLHSLMTRRTIVKKPTLGTTETYLAPSSAGNTLMRPQPQPTSQEAPSVVSVQDRLATIEQQLYPTFRRIGEPLQRRTLCRRKRSPSVETTPVLPEYDNFLFWGRLQSPIPELFVEDDTEMVESVEEHPHPDLGLASEYLQVALQDASMTTAAPTASDGVSASGAEISALQRRIALLESIVEKQSAAVQTSVAVNVQVSSPPSVKQQLKQTALLQQQLQDQRKEQADRQAQLEMQQRSHEQEMRRQRMALPNHHLLCSPLSSSTLYTSPALCNRLSLYPVCPASWSSNAQGIQSQPLPAKPATMEIEPRHADPQLRPPELPEKWISYGDSWVTQSYYDELMAKREAEMASKKQPQDVAIPAGIVGLSATGGRPIVIMQAPSAVPAASDRGTPLTARPQPPIHPQDVSPAIKESTVTSTASQPGIAGPRITASDPSLEIQPVAVAAVVAAIPKQPRQQQQRDVPKKQAQQRTQPSKSLKPKAPHGPQTAISTTTLVSDRSFESLLGEQRPSQTTHTPKRKLSEFIQSSLPPRPPSGSSTERDAEATKPDKLDSDHIRDDATPLLRRFVKVFPSAGYSITQVYKRSAIPTIFFVCVDVLVTFVRVFPKTLWVFWDVRTWDPYARTWTIWAIVADHELLIDVLPVLANVVLKVYGYRLTEIVDNPNARDSITQTRFRFEDVTNPSYSSFVLLVVFGITLLYTILFHAFRVAVPTLGVFVILKALFLIFDILTNALLLYQVLLYSGLRLLANDVHLQLMLSVVVPSPVITLTTNTLINLPMHFAFLRMQLQGKSDPETGQRGETISPWRLLRAATRRTFHPLIVLLFGSYAAYMSVALFMLLGLMLGFDPVAQIKGGAVPQGVLPTTGFFGWGGDDSNRGALLSGTNILMGMVWLNLVINYLVGVVSAIGYWTFAFGTGVAVTACGYKSV
ncbi:hypothetical protein BC831DRAFT_480595 [Entophlyctis helioformis]|nr:hypothetical protein BC831DRAFT_480595 [Entophlyctis helioformis]